jgi:hypothetical protein
MHSSFPQMFFFSLPYDAFSSRSVERKEDWRMMGLKNWERRCCDLIEVLCRPLSGVTEKTKKDLSRVNQCIGHDSNRAFPGYWANQFTSPSSLLKIEAKLSKTTMECWSTHVCKDHSCLVVHGTKHLRPLEHWLRAFCLCFCCPDELNSGPRSRLDYL